MTSLNDRYGVRTRPRWVWWVVAIVGIAIGVAWAAWVAFQPKDVSAGVHSYDVQSDTTTVVTLEIHRAEPIDVECSVYVQAQHHGIVGERTVMIPASNDKVVHTAIEVTTTERGVNGILRSCDATD